MRGEYCTITWNGREQRTGDHGTTANHTKGWSSSKEGDVYMWDWK